MAAHTMQSYHVGLTLELLDTSVPSSMQNYDLKNPLYRCTNHHGIPIPQGVPLTMEVAGVEAPGQHWKRSMIDMIDSVDLDIKRSRVDTPPI